MTRETIGKIAVASKRKSSFPPPPPNTWLLRPCAMGPRKSCPHREFPLSVLSITPTESLSLIAISGNNKTTSLLLNFELNFYCIYLLFLCVCTLCVSMWHDVHGHWRKGPLPSCGFWDGPWVGKPGAKWLLSAPSQQPLCCWFLACVRLF